jgi:ferric-dicitrate binding protein FerR (iron transport regulator)
MNPTLERAVSEIRDENIPDAVIDAAAARVWARLSEPAAEHIRHCADFQALIPDFRAGRLPEARALLVQDHLHECVACRHVFEGKVIPLPVRVPARRSSHAARWAVAAGVVAASGLGVWFAIVQLGTVPGRAIVQTVNGTLYEVSPAGIRVMAAGENLPDGVEIRTARDSGATLALRDGSLVEMRERSDFSTSQAGGEITVRLGHGSIIVQAAKRHSGHLYIATADCRVAVTGTLFSVSAGVKGSRVSVIEGEVHVTHDNQEKILHPGDQDSTSENLEPVTLNEDFSWTRNEALQRQLLLLREDLGKLHMPEMRYSSRLLGILPASTVFFASIPNLSQYLGQAQTVFRRKASENPELAAWLEGPGASIQPVLEKLRTANEYLGEEIAIFGTDGSASPVFLAEVKREGFAEFLKGTELPLAVETRSGFVLFSPRREALATALDGSFQRTPFYARINEAYRQGAGLLLCADLARLAPQRTPAGIRYLVAEQKEIGHQMETRAAIGFDGPRTGVAAWLAAPSPMGALDYVSPDATFVMAFAVTSPAAIFEQIPEILAQHQGLDVRNEAAASLGGEFAFALDGPVFPTPSWKLVVEVYDPVRFQAALEKFVAERNREAAAGGEKPLRTAQETAEGRSDYTIAGADANPLTEAHYTFSRGYLIAAPTRALLTRALQNKTNGLSIARSPGFMALIPRDAYTNFSGVVYQNLGTTLAPLAGLLGPKAGAAHLGNLKPFLVAAYGEPDRIAVASTGDVLGMSLNNFLSGSVFNLANKALPWAQVLGTTKARSSSR